MKYCHKILLQVLPPSSTIGFTAQCENVQFIKQNRSINYIQSKVSKCTQWIKMIQLNSSNSIHEILLRNVSKCIIQNQVALTILFPACYWWIQELFIYGCGSLGHKQTLIPIRRAVMEWDCTEKNMLMTVVNIPGVII